MATYTIQADYGGVNNNRSIISYADCHDSETGTEAYTSYVYAYQYKSQASTTWSIKRSALRFDLSTASGMVITGAKIRLYGKYKADSTAFNIVVVQGTFNVPILNSDFGAYGDTEHGSLASSSWNTSAWNEITLNSVGVAYITACQNDESEVKCGIRSSRDISESEPSINTAESVGAYEYNTDYPPELVLTVTDWPELDYPTDPGFPDIARADLATYSIINNCIDYVTRDVSSIFDADNNIDLDTAKTISWTGTGDTINYDSLNDRIQVTSISGDSGISVSGDLTGTDITVNVAITAANMEVTGDLALDEASYATIQSQVTDNETIWVQSTPACSTDEAVLYMEAASGDFFVKFNIGVDGVKSDILADYSGL